MLIAGNLSNSSLLTIGSPTYPALTRFYTGGTTGFSISAGSDGAFFYAAYGLVGSSAPLEVYGLSTPRTVLPMRAPAGDPR